MSNPALYLHVKLKHTPEGESVNTNEIRRGRGRPPKNSSYYNPTEGGRIDPTSDLFMRTEEAISLLFDQSHKDHPFYSYIKQFSFSKTPAKDVRSTKT